VGSSFFSVFASFFLLSFPVNLYILIPPSVVQRWDTEPDLLGPFPPILRPILVQGVDRSFCGSTDQ